MLQSSSHKIGSNFSGQIKILLVLPVKVREDGEFLLTRTSHVFMSVCVCVFQESLYSHAMKSLVTASTLLLLGLIVAYHGLEAQVSLLINCTKSMRLAEARS
jgi:Calcium-activated SK potassium channel